MHVLSIHLNAMQPDTLAKQWGLISGRPGSLQIDDPSSAPGQQTPGGGTPGQDQQPEGGSRRHSHQDQSSSQAVAGGGDQQQQPQQASPPQQQPGLSSPSSDDCPSPSAGLIVSPYGQRGSGGHGSTSDIGGLGPEKVPLQNGVPILLQDPVTLMINFILSLPVNVEQGNFQLLFLILAEY